MLADKKEMLIFARHYLYYMKQEQEQIDSLLEAVERVIGRKIEHPKDFDYLSGQVKGYTGEKISISTLKRIWGYVVSDGGISIYSLNLLSRLVGYDSWSAFIQRTDEDAESSHKIICRKLFTSSLTPGDLVSIIWKPEKKVVVQFEGQDLFVVVESVNSKLAAGDIFHCLQFIERQPLLLVGLYRKGMPPCDFICGRQGGIQWALVNKTTV